MPSEFGPSYQPAPVSPELAPENTWTRLTVQKCRAARELLYDLENFGTMPAGYRLTNFGIAQKLMDYSKRVLSDNDFWQTLPESVQVGGRTIMRDQLRSELLEILEESK